MSAKNPWLTAFKHALLIAVGIGVVGALLAGANVFGEPEKVARATGQLLFWIFLAAFATSAVFQHGHKWLAVSFGLVTLVLGGTVSALWLSVTLRSPEQPVPLSQSEQQSLLQSADRLRLCSEPLGFSVAALPDGFHPAPPEVQSLINERLAGHNGFAWVYQNEAVGERIVIQVIKGVGRKEATFRGFAKGLSETGSSNPQIVNEGEQLQWSNDGGEYSLRLRFPEAGTFSFRCLSTASSEHTVPLIVCAQTITQDSDALASYRKSLTLTGC